MAHDKTDPSAAIFPKWANYALPLLVLGAIGGALITPPIVFFGLSATTLNVGYRPEQPVPYSHAIHVGQLGLDCLHCHNTVDQASFAAIPPTATCINCHAPGEFPEGVDENGDGAPDATNWMGIWQNSPKLKAVHESFFTGEPIEWVKVHDLADYAYFNHSSHVNRGVGCYSCHGRVDQMGAENNGQSVWQVHELSMAWCIECHRAPEKALRPLDQVTNMTWHMGSEAVFEQLKAARGESDWTPEELQRLRERSRELGIPQAEGQSVADAQEELGRKLKESYLIHSEAYMQACSTCHR
ncbi:MAG: cytochrome c3 family protein [Planctomycetota bacterium]